MVGVTSPDPPPHYANFEAWLEAGRHAEMGYLATERSRFLRADPRRISSECRSVLILGIPYPAYSKYFSIDQSPQSRGTSDRFWGEKLDDGIHGQLAAYAWGKDYHDLLPVYLHKLVSSCEEILGERLWNRCYTDTGPLLECDLGQRAGLGWIGKNTCLIHPQWGSYFFLAEVLLPVELEPDEAFAYDRCGTCRRCMDACPTACIQNDRTIDAGRCISYLTIELKGSIPRELRQLTSNWVFGCDVCQQVCPWNKTKLKKLPERFVFEISPNSDVSYPDLLRELSLTPDMFRQKFKGSPVQRARRPGYLRNVAVALGNTGDPAAIPVLTQVLQNEPESLVRGHAAWALAKIGGRLAKYALDQARYIETDEMVLGEIYAALDDI
jgi:epoxyqueuosine reductase